MNHYEINENISYHVLFELSSINLGEYEEDIILEKSLPLYLRKLNCYAAAIFEYNLYSKFDYKVVLPKSFSKNKEWTAIDSIINQISHPNFEKDKYYEFLNDSSSYYIYELNGYGCLVLCSNKSFSNQLKNELTFIFNGLSKSLVLSKEILQRKKFESKLYESLHQLDLFYSFMDHSQDAIQVSHEDGQMIYINKVASERLGINQTGVEKYFVYDIELLFKDNPEAWKKHVEELKIDGKQTINGKNININTGETFFVEVTVSIQIIDNKGYVIAISRDVTQKKISEQELIKTTDSLQSVGRMTLTGAWEINLKTKTILLNEVAKVVLDLDPNINDNHTLMSIFDNIISTSKDLKNKFRSLELENIKFDSEFEIKTYNNTFKHIRIVADSNEHNQIIYGAIQDITEKSITLQKLNVSESKFRSFVENANEIIFNIDINGNIIYISPNVKERLGFNHDEIVGKHISMILHKDDLKHAQTILKGIIRTNQKYSNAIYRIKNCEGEVRWYIMSGSKLSSSKANSESILGLAHDITIIKNAEDELKKSKVSAEKLAIQYKSILDTQSVFIIKLDKSGIIKYINDYYIFAVGYTDSENGNSELLQTPIYNRIINDDKVKLKETIRNCINNPLTTYSTVVKEVNKVNVQKVIRWEIRALIEQYLDMEFLCVGIDITEQFINLERANQLLSITAKQNFKLKNFAYIVSHNIRSHSANISGLIRELKDVGNVDERDYFLHLLEAGAEKLNETIFNLNEIISINENSEKEYIIKNLKEEIDKTFSILSSSIIHEKIKIDSNVSKSLNVRVIAPYLDSILLNMLSNAVKYRNDSNPQITVRASQLQQFVRISFIDNGLGIDLKKYGHKLFGMYKTFHKNKDSRGLGLFITKAQIEAMGGRVEVESEPGLGTTFHVFLPAASTLKFNSN